MQVTGQTTFSQIYDQMRSKTLNRDTQIRGTADGTQLYVHKATMAHGKGVAAATARAQKEGQGASMIKDSIDRQYGAGWGNRVFQHVHVQTGTNLATSVKRSDLTTLNDTIASLKASDAHTLQNGTIGEKLNLLAQMPLDQTSTKALIAIAQDAVNASGAERDTAMDLLQGKIMGASAETRQEAFSLPGSLSIDKPSVSALFTLRMSDGSRAFSVADLTTLTRDAFSHETPTQKPADFFRDNSFATFLVADGLANLDNGKIPAMANTILTAIQAEITQAGLNNAPMTVTNNGRNVPNPAILNNVLTQADNLMGQQVQTPELQTFLQGVEGGIDAGPPPTGWSGSQFVKNALLLRGLNGAVMEVCANAGAEPRKLGTSLTAVIQRAVNQNAPFAATSPHAGSNPALANLLAPGSGFRTFVGTVP